MEVSTPGIAVPVPAVSARSRSVVAPKAIADLVTTDLCVPADAPVRRLIDLFEKDPGMDSIAVIRAPGRVGLVCRSRFFIQLGQRFGYSIFENRPVEMLAEEGSVVQADAVPMDVVHLALQREPSRIYDDLIVMDGNRYRGLVSMRSLIAHHKDLLASSLNELAALDEKHRQLQELNRVQSEFVSNMTHELRSPINVIMGVGRVLAGDPATTPGHRRNLAILLGRAQDLLGIVDNLLDLSKLEAGAMSPVLEPVDIEAFLQEVVSDTEPLVGRKPVELRVAFRSLPPSFETDAQFLRRILDNLLSNAVKFTEYGTITLQASLEGRELVLSVIDTGVGIHSDDLSRLFRRFTQLESPKTKRRPGTGLGLAIVKGLVDALGGALTVESQPGSGSTFTVHVPAGRPDGVRAWGPRPV
jgi:signal transduction histidine kinase